MGSPAADSSKTTTLKTNFAGKMPLRTHAESGQVEPVLGGKLAHASWLLELSVSLAKSLPNANG
jgi:hypothetical protein